MAIKVKIGQGYYPSGRAAFNKRPIVWNIGGKAFVKDASNTPFETSLDGYTMVNQMSTPRGIKYCSVGLKTEHKDLWNTEKKTGIAWLEQAKEYGYEWADSALSQADDDAKDVWDNLYEAVQMFATWDKTKEGYTFWSNIQQECKGF